MELKRVNVDFPLWMVEQLAPGGPECTLGCSHGPIKTTGAQSGAQASIKGRRVRFPSHSRRAAGAVTRSALIWLMAQVLPSVAESLATYCCAEADG